MTIASLAANPPNVHFDYMGKPWCMGVDAAALHFIAARVTPESATIETGAGISTLAFILNHTRHTVVCPETRIFENITRLCDPDGLSYDQVAFIDKPSQEFLPSLPAQAFDLALIDGDHAFPVPIVDFYYLSRALKVGGVIMIDDVCLWPCEQLRRFLTWQPQWRLLSDSMRWSAFEKKEHLEVGWYLQPYTVLNSTSVPEYVARRFQGNP